MDSEKGDVHGISSKEAPDPAIALPCPAVSKPDTEAAL